MPRIVVCLLVAVAMAPSLVAQGPVVPRAGAPPSNPGPRDVEYPVTVEGCLRGNRLEIDRTRHKEHLALVQAREFSLEGPKELLQQLRRDHDGHRVEISGIAVVTGVHEVEGEVTTIDVGDRTRIVGLGRSASRDGASSGPRPVRLKVRSLTHLDDRCAVR
jgi:hypothetical protein